jgi:hypothetical protein
MNGGEGGANVVSIIDARGDRSLGILMFEMTIFGIYEGLCTI